MREFTAEQQERYEEAKERMAAEKRAKKDALGLNVLYPFIRVWGRAMGSYDYYIVAQQKKACFEGADSNAIYQRDDKSWCTIDEINGADRIDAAKVSAMNIVKTANKELGYS